MSRHKFLVCAEAGCVECWRGCEHHGPFPADTPDPRPVSRWVAAENDRRCESRHREGKRSWRCILRADHVFGPAIQRPYEHLSIGGGRRW